MKGLRRSAGLNLLNFAMQMDLDRWVFMDLLQWFVTSLRANRDQVAHYTDNITGCGDSVVAAIGKEFFQIIKQVVLKIKRGKELQIIKGLLGALIWNYRGNDMKYLAKFNIIDVIQRGDGRPMHPIRLAWGNNTENVIMSTLHGNSQTLAANVMKVFEFLFKQVLSQVILLDADQDQNQAPGTIVADKKETVSV